MDLDTAPVAERDDDDAACAVCDDGEYVLYDGDRVCRRCGHLSGTGDATTTASYRERHLPPEWQTFESERDRYEGFRGEGRIKFVGGFGRAYDWGADV